MRTPLEPGTILQGRYKVISLAGSRGTGFVYRVGGLILDKEFALKEMYIDSQNPEDIARVTQIFQNEAETLAKLDHSGIPKIYDAFFENEKYYLVMDFIPGSTLEKMLTETPQYFFEASVLEWTEQIMEILEYLHSLPTPVVVRDLKPSNIMLTPRGEIKIIDFGIAKLFDGEEGDGLPVKGRGTEGFAPPEQYEGEEVDQRSDIYSLGATLYFLLAKKIIPHSPDRAGQREKITPPSFYNPMVSKGLDAMILRMIELQPEQRFQNVAELREFMNRNNLRIHGRQVLEDTSHSPMPATKARLDTTRMTDRASGEKSGAFQGKAPAVPPSTGTFCPQCRAVVMPGDQFCPGCGIKVQPAGSIQAEAVPASASPRQVPASGDLTRSGEEQPLWKKAAFKAVGGILIFVAVVVMIFVFSHEKNGKEGGTASPSPSPLSRDAEYYISHGSKKFNEKDFRGAIADFDQVILLKPDNYTAYFKRGMAKCKVKDYDASLSDFSMALRLRPDSQEALNSRGLASFEKGDRQAAMKDFNRLIEIEPDAYWAFNNRGLVYLDEKKYREARDDFKMAIEINPEDSDAFFNMAVLYLEKEDYDKARDYINRSIKRNPSADAYEKRGEIFYAEDNNEKALEDFNRAIELDRNYARAYLKRGNLYSDRKEHKKADDDWNRAASLDPDGRDGKDAKDALKKN